MVIKNTGRLFYSGLRLKLNDRSLACPPPVDECKLCFDPIRIDIMVVEETTIYICVQITRELVTIHVLK